MHFLNLNDFYLARQRREQPLVMATVIETRGSTYSKAGERMLIDGQGIFRGMLSGGCLEGDLAIRAQQVIENGQPQTVTYDLIADDELWGLGVGCEGIITVFLQALTPGDGYEPFAKWCELQLAAEASAYAMLVESAIPDSGAGAAVFVSDGVTHVFAAPSDVGELLAAQAVKSLTTGQPSIGTIEINNKSARFFRAPINPVPRLLILGAGLDAEPVVRFASELGWLCTVADHRPAYIDSNDFGRAERLHCGPAGELAEHLALNSFDLAIVMSHHLVTDRTYLAQLATSRIGYIGLLGPPGRKRRLMTELGEAAAGLEHRLHGPAGIDLGGRGPAAIALSIVAQMQQSVAQTKITPTLSEESSE
ncbi:MAG: XdhC family protein [Woeseiaceae bacterium]|nr:XdhC family protein [Woeseiaceae bacterium]